MKPIFLYFSIVVFSCFQAQQKNTQKEFILQNGDLIFQEACTGNMNEAIKQVTSGIGGYNFTHVGMIWINSNGIYVIEATHPQVKVTPLQEYLNPKEKGNCPPKSVVGRLKEPYQKIIPRAIEESLKLVGNKYDDAFDLSNDQYYCSELIYQALYKANENRTVFPLNVMTFKNESGEYSSYWISHFKILGIPIPEGKLGINPGEMSKSEVINIVYYYK